MIDSARHRAAVAVSLVAALAGCTTGGQEAATPTASPGRELLWSDEFQGAAGSLPDPAMWTAELGAGGWGNQELQSYTGRARNVSHDGAGSLAIRTHREAFTGADHIEAPWTSARITTLDKREVRYGRLEVRAKVPAGDGLWPAAWTMGTNIREVGWPACGEIDVIESVNDATEAIQTLHGPRADHRDWTATLRSKVAPLSDAFHVYAVEWTEGRVEFQVDGRTTHVVTPADLPPGSTWTFDGTPQYVLLNVAVGGGLPGPPSASTPDSSTMLVDYVRAYGV